MPEVKILILLSNFIIFGLVVLVNFSYSITENNSYLEHLYEYFTCQLGGFDPMCEDIRRQFEKHLQPELTALTYLLMGSITAIQTQDVKKLIQGIRSHFHASV